MLLSDTWTHQSNVHGKPFPSSLSHMYSWIYKYTPLYIFIALCGMWLFSVWAHLYLCSYTYWCYSVCVCVSACVTMSGVYNQGMLCECVWCGCDSWLLSFLRLFVSLYGRRSFLIIFVVPAAGAVFSIAKRISANEPDETRRGARTNRRSAQLKLTW